VIRAVVARTLAVLLVAAAWSPRPVRADAVVGTGTANSCTEAALDAGLAAGGNITFKCGSSPVTITVTYAETISVNTSIDGGGLITFHQSERRSDDEIQCDASRVGLGGGGSHRP
jgi:hypothetical protein